MKPITARKAQKAAVTAVAIAGPAGVHEAASS